MLPDKTVLVVYSVHLKTNSGGVYVVIGGDFKSDPTSEKWDEGDTLRMIQGARWGKHGRQHPRIIVQEPGRESLRLEYLDH
jgi:hypothetical protein